MTKRSWLLFLTLTLALASFGFMIFTLDTPLPEQQPDADQGKVIELYAEGIVSRQFDELGAVSQVFKADRLTKYRGDDRTHLLAPVMDTFEQGSARWNASSNNGLFTNEGEVLLTGDVSLISLNSSNNFSLNTDQLKIVESKGSVSTQSPVIMKTKAGTISSVGVSFNLNQEVIHFHSDVDAIYDPQIN